MAQLVNSTPVDLTGYTLVMPALSVGNVCQMAVDLLLNTFLNAPNGSVIKVGHLAQSSVQPSVGPNAFGRAGLTVNMELFAVHAAKVIFLQQRAPCVQDMHEIFVHELFGWSSKAGIAEVVVLAAVDAGGRPDAYLKRGPQPFHIPTTATSVDASKRVESAGVRRWVPSDGSECRVTEVDEEEAAAACQSASGGVVPSGWTAPSARAIAATKHNFGGLWGSGYAPVYWRRAETDGKALDVLGIFVAEGDNRAEAHQLASIVARCFGLLFSEDGGKPSDAAAAIAPKLAEPPYWQHLYGPSFDQSMYW